ncbi:MAG: hypothetical protein WD270_02635 [Acetobacterales bacterium]
MFGLGTGDALGLIGSLLLLYAPGRDQVLRLRVWRRSAPATKPAPDSLQAQDPAIAAGYESRRNRWNFQDSLTMSAGAILLALSFWVQE